MTWADIAAKNAPPPSEQPQPDQSLLEGHFEGETEQAQTHAGQGGVTVVEHDFKEHPHTIDTGITPETVKRDEEFAKAQAEAKIQTAKLQKEADAKAAELKASAKATAASASETATQTKEVVQDKAAQASAVAQEKASEGAQVVKENAAVAEKKAGEVKEVVKEQAGEAKKKAGEVKDVVVEKAGEAKKDVEKKAAEAKAWAEKEAKVIKKEAKSTFAKLYVALMLPQYFVPLITAIDAAVVGGLAYTYITRRDARLLPIDQRTINTVAVGLGALFSIEAYAANSYFSKRDFTSKKL